MQSTLQNYIRRAMSENQYVYYQQNLPNCYGSKENIRNVNLLFPKVHLSRSATVNIKQQNQIRMKVDSSTEGKIKEAINKKQRQIEELNSKEKDYQNACDQLRKQLKEAKQNKDQKWEENCRIDIQNLLKQMEIQGIGRNRSELRVEISELKKQLKELRESKI